MKTVADFRCRKLIFDIYVFFVSDLTRDLKSIGMTWEEAEQAAVDREDWHGCVAQCVFDTG